jgi:hypothetical protein
MGESMTERGNVDRKGGGEEKQVENKVHMMYKRIFGFNRTL